MKVQFLGRTKKYGKWIPYTVTIENADKKDIAKACRDHVKKETGKDYVEVQSIEKVDSHAEETVSSND